MPEHDNDLQITFHGAATHRNSVPVDILATSLRSLQDVIHVLAASHDAIEHGSSADTASVSTDIRRRYAVICHLPTPGSYAVPVTIAGAQAAPLEGDEHHVLDDLQTLFRAAQEQNEADLDRLFPVHAHRVAAARALDKMVPAAKSGTRLTIESSSGQEVFAPNRGTGRFLKSITANSAAETEQSVIGHLNGIDFQKQRIRLRHPPSGCELRCPYPPEVEPILVDCRRDLIQVVGDILLRPDASPRRIGQVDSILPVDTSPIELTKFVSGTEKVRAKRAITFRPTIHEGYKHFVLKEAPFGIHLLSVTRQELETNLLEELDVIWRHYARANDADLMPDALELKRQLHSVFHVA